MGGRGDPSQEASVSVRTRLGLPAVPAAQGLADPKQTRPGGGGRQNPCGYTRGVWGAPPGGRRGRGGPPGGPPGPGGVHFRGYLITLPVGTEWNFGFFGIFGPPGVYPPKMAPLGDPPKPPFSIVFGILWEPKNPQNGGFRGVGPEPPPDPPGGPPGPRARGGRARGAPGGPPGGPPRGAPGTPPGPPSGTPRETPLGTPGRPPSDRG